MVALCTTTLAGCRLAERQQILPHETLAISDARVDLSLEYREPAPALLVFAEPGEIVPDEDSLLHPDSQLAAQLREVDYVEKFAVLVLREYGLSTGFIIDIERVTRNDNEVTIYAGFGVPQPGMRIPEILIAPYHLLAVSKIGSWGETIHFRLVVEGETLAETSHFIP
jgi:hypothetical protein